MMSDSYIHVLSTKSCIGRISDQGCDSMDQAQHGQRANILKVRKEIYYMIEATRKKFKSDHLGSLGSVSHLAVVLSKRIQHQKWTTQYEYDFTILHCSLPASHNTTHTHLILKATLCT